jgi:hypothetical protein
MSACVKTALLPNSRVSFLIKAGVILLNVVIYILNRFPGMRGFSKWKIPAGDFFSPGNLQAGNIKVVIS